MNPSPSILLSLVCLALVILGATIRLSAQTPHTPKPGSPERQAICDAMRVFVKAEYAEKTLPKPVVFKIDTLRVQGDLANLKCLPLFSVGTAAIPQYLPDIGYNHCLQSGPNVLESHPRPQPHRRPRHHRGPPDPAKPPTHLPPLHPLRLLARPFPESEMTPKHD